MLEYIVIVYNTSGAYIREYIGIWWDILGNVGLYWSTLGYRFECVRAYWGTVEYIGAVWTC